VSNFQAPGDWSLSEAVGKRLLTPGGAVSPGVAPELMPVLVLENDRPENMLLSYQRLFGRSATVSAGGAGTRASVRLVNNRADTLVVVSLVGSTSAFQMGVERGALGTLPFGSLGTAAGLPRDTRIQPPGTAIAGISTATLVSDNTLGASSARLHGGGAGTYFTTPIILGPADMLFIQASSDATALNDYSIQWMERRLNPSERA
jgi:hypothetical protein